MTYLIAYQMWDHSHNLSREQPTNRWESRGDVRNVTRWVDLLSRVWWTLLCIWLWSDISKCAGLTAFRFQHTESKYTWVHVYVCVHVLHVHITCLKDSIWTVCTFVTHTKQRLCASIYFFIRKIVTIRLKQNWRGQHRNKIMATQRYLESTLTLRSLTLSIYGAPILDVSRSHTTTQHSR